jgi:hypothetical protein
VYLAGLSALSKAIILQAETEVTAAPKAAVPLAGVIVRLLTRLPEFHCVLWGRMVQRTGAWCIPCGVPSQEPSGERMGIKSKKKAMGMKDGESAGDYVVRVAGLMRLYFEVMKISSDAQSPLENEWRFPRAWTWLTRLMGRLDMLGSPVAPHCIFGRYFIRDHCASSLFTSIHQLFSTYWEDPPDRSGVVNGLSYSLWCTLLRRRVLALRQQMESHEYCLVAMHPRADLHGYEYSWRSKD